MFVRGIRGASTVKHNEEKEILDGTLELLQHIVADNGIQPEDIGSVFITVTQDLNATFPAKAIRQMPGWELVPLMCSVEIPVDNSIPMCIRMMIMMNTTKRQNEIVHVYLNETVSLRPDLSEGSKA